MAAKSPPFAFSIIATRDRGTRRGILLVVLGVVERFLPRGIEVAVVRIVIRVPSQTRTGPNQLAGRWRLLNRRCGNMTVEGAGLEDKGDGNLRKNAEPYRAVAES